VLTRTASERAVVGSLLCLVSEDVPVELGAALRAAAAAAPGVAVVTERRGQERRARVGLREEASSMIRMPAAGTTFRADRRRSERRMEVRAATPPSELRDLVAGSGGAVRFVRRLGTPAADAKATELIQRVQAGDADALDELYRLYLAPLYGYMVVTLRDHHAAEDAVHEVFVRVLRALPRYELRGIPFRIWLFRIARNHVLNLARGDRPEDTSAPEDVTRNLDRQVDEWEGMGDLTDDDFLRLIHILPLGQRQVLVLRYAFDMSFAEIASVLGTTSAAARNQQRRAFTALRPRMLARRRAGGVGSYDAMSAHRRQPHVGLQRRQALVYGARL
jgi:RNA polymerase sigma-70 factor (ECF subfamily)